MFYLFIYYYCSTISIKILPREIPSRVDIGTTLKWQIHGAGFLRYSFFFQLIGCNYYEKKSMYVIVN
jgi:hypothetical protein